MKNLLLSLLLVIVIVVCTGVTSVARNPWVRLECDKDIVWVRRDAIVYVSDHRSDKMIEHHGKSMISLINGQELRFDSFTADELIERINR